MLARKLINGHLRFTLLGFSFPVSIRDIITSMGIHIQSRPGMSLLFLCIYMSWHDLTIDIYSELAFWWNYTHQVLKLWNKWQLGLSYTYIQGLQEKDLCRDTKVKASGNWRIYCVKWVCVCHKSNCRMDNLRHVTTYSSIALSEPYALFVSSHFF